MSILKAIPPMRIIALPLTRAAILPHTSTNTGGISDPALTFYHFQLRLPPDSDAIARNERKKQGRIKTLVKWVSTKALDTWAGFGKAPEGNWKVCSICLPLLRPLGRKADGTRSCERTNMANVWLIG
jgi:hypothetical protein